MIVTYLLQIFLSIPAATLAQETYLRSSPRLRNSHSIESPQAPQHQRSVEGGKSLNFNYIPGDLFGPDNWQYVDTQTNEWQQYVNADDVNLDRTTTNQCNDGKKESPVNLVPNINCTATHQILTEDPHPNDCSISDLKFRITPNSLRAYFPTDSDKCRIPTIDLPNGFPFLWDATWIEIKLRAEHMVDGRRYDGELVMAHLGHQDDNREVAFVSVLLDATAYVDDPKIASYIGFWETFAYATAQQCNDETVPPPKRRGYPKQSSFKLPNNAKRTLPPKPFPYDIWPTIYFYRYRGSLTEPPCTSMVNWRVFNEPLKISKRQLKKLAALINDYVRPSTCQRETVASPTGETNRPIQQFDYDSANIAHCTEANYRPYEKEYDMDSIPEDGSSEAFEVN